MLGFSIILLSLGTFFFICNWMGFYQSKKREGGYSFAPFITGIFLFAGMMLIPVELPLPRLLCAFLVMCLDHTIWLNIPWLLYLWYRGDLKE
jgi:hypothetical protein